MELQVISGIISHSSLLGCGGLLWSQVVLLWDYCDTDNDFDTEQDTDDHQQWSSPDGNDIGFWKSDGHCFSIWEKMTIMLYQPVDCQTNEKVSCCCWQTDKNVTGISLFCVWRGFVGGGRTTHMSPDTYDRVAERNERNLSNFNVLLKVVGQRSWC